MMPGKYQIRRSVSLRAASHIALIKLAERGQTSQSALVERWIAEKAEAAGITVGPEEVEQTLAARREARDRHEQEIEDARRRHFA
jgi:hypothetical protein